MCFGGGGGGQQYIPPTSAAQEAAATATSADMVKQRMAALTQVPDDSATKISPQDARNNQGVVITPPVGADRTFDK